MFESAAMATIVAGLLLAGGLVALFYFLLKKPEGAGRMPRAAAGGGPDASVAIGRPGKVSLRAVVERLATVGDEETVYLDRTTGAFVTLEDDLRALLESADLTPEALEGFDQTPQQLMDMRRKLRSKAYLMLPTKLQTRPFELQDRFCQQLPEGEARAQMLKVLSGRAGFRSFDGAVKRLGLMDQWTALRDAEFAKVAVAWLTEHGLECEHDLPAARDAA